MHTACLSARYRIFIYTYFHVQSCPSSRHTHTHIEQNTYSLHQMLPHIPYSLHMALLSMMSDDVESQILLVTLYSHYC